jgi:hypothetical protein
VGSVLGFSMAFLSYTIYWPNPFKQPTDNRSIRQPRILYRPAPADTAESKESTRRRREAFELAPAIEANQAEDDERVQDANDEQESEPLVKDNRDTNGGHGQAPVGAQSQGKVSNNAQLSFV